jgi:very-short-patch-repair endonuclease
MSLPEICLWNALRGRQESSPAFRRQHPIGPYVLDFYCSKARLCIEVDGNAHAHGDRPSRDAARDRFLREMGIEVVRVAAREVLANPASVASGLIQLAASRSAPSTASRSPSPALPSAGEEV